jgi:iron complex transport system ATP-binding protein
VLHDLNLAALADRVLVLADGSVAADGPPATALTAAVVTRVFGNGLTVTEVGGRIAVLPR